MCNNGVFPDEFNRPRDVDWFFGLDGMYDSSAMANGLGSFHGVVFTRVYRVL